MRVLGIETATDVGSVALVDATGLVGERTVRRPMHALEWLVPAVHGLLGDVGLDVEAVEGVAVSTGPGSFTGLRVGIATAVGWARARQLPACGVPTLEALAGTVDAPAVGVVVDAKRGEVAGALFVRSEGGWVRVVEEVVGSPEVVARVFREAQGDGARCVLAGDGLRQWAEVFTSTLPRAHVASPVLWSPRAGAVAWLGRQRLLAGGAQQLTEIQPRYGRTPAFREARRT